MSKTKIWAVLTGLVGLLLAASPALAHVVVKPSQVGIGSYQEFTMGVPSEKDSSTMSIRLVIPGGLSSVTPNVKPGWTIEVKKTGEGDSAKVTEIDWTGGSIPSGQRDDFLFQAQVPAQPTTLQWKAYQTYADGEEVDWINPPTTKADDDSAPPPYSQTKVINDLTVSPAPASSNSQGGNNTALTTLVLVALALSAVSISMQLRRKK